MSQATRAFEVSTVQASHRRIRKAGSINRGSGLDWQARGQGWGVQAEATEIGKEPHVAGS